MRGLASVLHLISSRRDSLVCNADGVELGHMSRLLTSFKSDCTLRHIFLLGQHFGVANSRGHDGDSALLRACHPDCSVNFSLDPTVGVFDSERNIRKFDFLLSKGCSIYDINDWGSTCLHVFFRSIVPPPSAQSWRDTLIYLIQRGADVYARDFSGNSISDIAYSVRCLSMELKTGSYPGDLWDAVLVLSGLDIHDLRKRDPRRKKYGENYSRQDFELLWKDHEHECPYWDDMDWPKADDSGGCEDPGSSPAILCVCELEDGCPLNFMTEATSPNSQNGDEDSIYEASLAEVQRYSSPASDEYRPFLRPPTEQTSSAWIHSTNGTHQYTQEQRDRHDALPPAWQLVDDHDAIWNSATLDISYPHPHSQNNVDTLQHGELFYSPWRDDQGF